MCIGGEVKEASFPSVADEYDTPGSVYKALVWNSYKERGIAVVLNT